MLFDVIVTEACCQLTGVEDGVSLSEFSCLASNPVNWMPKRSNFSKAIGLPLTKYPNKIKSLYRTANPQTGLSEASRLRPNVSSKLTSVSSNHMKQNTTQIYTSNHCSVCNNLAHESRINKKTLSSSFPLRKTSVPVNLFCFSVVIIYCVHLVTMYNYSQTNKNKKNY